MSDRSIDITIRARDEASATLKQVDANFRSFGSGLNSVLGIGSILGAATMTTHVIKFAADLGSAIDMARLGEWEKLQDIVYTLPLGFGPMLKSLDRFCQMADQAELAAKRFGEALVGIRAREAGREAGLNVAETYMRKGDLVGAAETATRLGAIRDEFEAQIEALRAKGVEYGSKGWNDAVRFLGEWRQKAETEARRKAAEARREAYNRELGDQQARNVDMSAQMDREAAERTLRARNEQNEALKLQADHDQSMAAIRDRAFAATSTQEEVELKSVDDYYERLRATVKMNEEELSETFASQGVERYAIVSRHAKEAVSAPWQAAPLYQSRFMTGGPAVENPAVKTNQILGKVAETLEQMNRREAQDRPPGQAGTTVRIEGG